VGRRGGLLNYPPDYEGNSQPPEDCFQTHVASQGRTDLLC
jgi:hypothetical protein